MILMSQLYCTATVLRTFKPWHRRSSNTLLLRPKIGIICGTGLGGIGDVLEDPVPVPYEVIPDFPVSTGKNSYITSCLPGS